jgi:hypothetical protein
LDYDDYIYIGISCTMLSRFDNCFP